MDDGLLDFVFIKTPKSLADMDKIRSELTDESRQSECVIRLRSDELILESENPVDWDLDGEFGGNFSKAVFSVQKQAMIIAAPNLE